jgi:toxin-antitoxin system PIN domain toxin
MSVSLLDVNVLVALLDPLHEHHERAHRWFGRHKKNGWATCPLTFNACVRIISNPGYPTVEAPPAEVIRRLGNFCTSADHHFWPDSVSLVDEGLFVRAHMRSHKDVTDIYLLGLAARNHGRLATFDTGIVSGAVIGGARALWVIEA